MSFNRPTPNELLSRIQAEFDIGLATSEARLRYSMEGVLARVLAMVSHELHGYLDFISKQILVDTASEEYLDRHGSLWGIPRKLASSAIGAVQFTGVNDTIIPAASVIKRSDGIEYVTDADVTIAGGVANANITASVTGASGNAVTGVKLSLTSPIAGVVSESTVLTPGIVFGADIEDDEDYRGRIIERIQNPPQGGAEHDYIKWAKEVAGVTRVWVYPEQLGDGTVQVIFVMDGKVGTIIPTVDEVEQVQDYIDAPERKPTTADVTVTAPTAVPIAFEIHLNPNTAKVQNAVRAELEDLFTRESYPGGTILHSHLAQAISTADGEFDHVIVSPVGNIARSFGEISTLGTITWDGM